jgi:DNA-binding beta-propeller fold protein YncE
MIDRRARIPAKIEIPRIPLASEGNAIMKTSFLVTVGACATLAVMVGAPLSWAQNGAPHYEVDASWPKPLPDRWVLGGLGGVCVDAQDHVVILNRQDILEGELDAGRMAPSIIEFDSAGNVVNSWSKPDLLDPRLHSCHFDKENNFWVAAAPSGVVQKFTHDGSKLLLQIGKKGVLDSSDGTIKGTPLNSSFAQFHMPSSIFVDRDNGDVYVSDGEGRNSNRRIAVMDREGQFLRQWKPEGMENVHCMTIGHDGLVYVCNRDNARIQVYDKQGNLKRNIELPWKPVTMPADGKIKQFGGATVAIDFSPDPEQTYMFVVNQNNSQIDIVDRKSGKLLSSFGSIGKQPGQFDQAHGIAVDSKGNVYVDENRGRRVHKFKIVQ